MESLSQTRIKLAWWLSSSSGPSGNRTLPFVFITSLGCGRGTTCMWLCLCARMFGLEGVCLCLRPTLKKQTNKKKHHRTKISILLFALSCGFKETYMVVKTHHFDLNLKSMCNICAGSLEVTLPFGIVPPAFTAYNIGFGHFIAFASEYLINTQRL